MDSMAYPQQTVDLLRKDCINLVKWKRLRLRTHPGSKQSAGVPSATSSRSGFSETMGSPYRRRDHAIDRLLGWTRVTALRHERRRNFQACTSTGITCKGFSSNFRSIPLQCNTDPTRIVHFSYPQGALVNSFDFFFIVSFLWHRQTCVIFFGLHGVLAKSPDLLDSLTFFWRGENYCAIIFAF